MMKASTSTSFFVVSRPSAGSSRPTDGRIRRLAAFLFFLISVLVLLIRPVTSGIVLNDFVRHFEPLFYDHHDLRAQHSRSKRESILEKEDQQLRLQFTAHNRLFKIRLRRSAGAVFADDVLLESTKGPVAYDMDNVYEGELEDDDQSSVSAVLTTDGYLDATVTTASETYYVEPAWRYFPGNNRSADEDSSSFPAVIYKSSDVVHPDRDHHQESSCSSHQFYLKHFEESKRIEQELIKKQHCANNRPAIGRNAARCNQSSPTVISHHDDDHDAGSMLERDQLIDRTLYSGWDRSQDEPHQQERRRRRKKKRSNSIDPRKTTCMLYLQADHLFYSKMGSEEACIETMTRHVQRVNTIYKNIDFDGDGQPDEINFMIKRIKVHTEQALNEASYRFPGNYGVEKFLELFSEEDYNAFCLAYMFTYRDFEGGTLGLAWTGDLKNAGGVCEKNGHYRGSLKSLNTGIVTLLNYGKHVPPAVSHVTLAHEIGHNFGSPHDPENNRDCTPGGEDGNYIMFARATSGDKKNNNKFSPCSLKSINGVLSTKARNDHGCFTEPQSAICGNGVVEAGEECDCGWEEDCKEKCCYPMRSTLVPGEKPCTLRPMRACSPSQGPCCTEDCHLRYGVKCRDDNGCRDAAYCDGTGPKCPLSNNKPNKTVCNEEFVCFMGECTGSICIAYGLQSCQCLQGPSDPPTKACELCCKLPGDDQPCLSSFEWNSPPYDVPDAHAKAGTPCNNYNGYCDVFQRCREVDPSGPLATLRRLLLSDESIASLKKWAEDHWYGVLFIAIGFITVIVVIARVFGRRVQKMRQHSRQHRSSHHRTTNGGVMTVQEAAATAAAVDESPNPHIVHPVAVRTKIPLKRKVREKEGKKNNKRPSGNKTYSSSSIKALALLRRPMRQHRQQQHRRPRDPAAAERQRRSGVVSTQQKVRSWLERENPTRETIDSDNESQFPEEEQLGSKENNADRRQSVVDTKGPLSTSQSNLQKATSNQSSEPGKAPAAVNKEQPPSDRKMMRSISETTRERNGRHNFSRSISHGNEPDFRGLNRKTESHSHLLANSKSELDLDVKPLEEEEIATAAAADTISGGSNGEEVTHPPVQKRIPKASGGGGHIPKSATESQLAKAPVGPDRQHQPSHHKKRFSSDFLNLLMTGKTSTSSSAPPADVITNNKKRISRTEEPTITTTPTVPAANRKTGADEKKKKIGLGPVKVVLKWHGSCRISSNRPKRTGDPKNKTRPHKKKRVIVYKNGNPTVPPVACPPPKLDLAEVREVESKKEPVINITANPLEAIEPAVTKRHPTPSDKMRNGGNGEAVRSPRRYSMLDRQPPPTLMRRVSEVHYPSVVNNNQRRNRHSWTSACAPGPLPELSAAHVGIRIDDDDDDPADEC